MKINRKYNSKTNHMYFKLTMEMPWNLHIENINNHKYNFVHPLIKQKIYDMWIKKHERELKLLRILE
jgi:hypothetical protein